MAGDPDFSDDLSADGRRGRSRVAWAAGVVLVIVMIALLVFNLLV